MQGCLNDPMGLPPVLLKYYGLLQLIFFVIRVSPTCCEQTKLIFTYKGLQLYFSLFYSYLDHFVDHLFNSAFIWTIM